MHVKTHNLKMFNWTVLFRFFCCLISRSSHFYLICLNLTFCIFLEMNLLWTNSPIISTHMKILWEDLLWGFILGNVYRTRQNNFITKLIFNPNYGKLFLRFDHIIIFKNACTILWRLVCDTLRDPYADSLKFLQYYVLFRERYL